MKLISYSSFKFGDKSIDKEEVQSLELEVKMNLRKLNTVLHSA